MYASNQLLRDADALSMCHSLEVRVPLLDDALVEGVLALASSAKQGSGVKPLLVKAMRDVLPGSVLQRNTKQGFTFPFESWLEKEFSDMVDTALSASALRQIGWLDPAAVDSLRDGFRSGRVHWSRIWALVVLQGWSDAVGINAA
jgi:asparagine synthase (glutamine-hydrolysing)